MARFVGPADRKLGQSDLIGPVIGGGRGWIEPAQREIAHFPARIVAAAREPPAFCRIAQSAALRIVDRESTAKPQPQSFALRNPQKS